MFKDYLDFKKSMNGKKVFVAGIGVSNTPLIKMLAEFGAKVTACDKKTKEELGHTADILIDLGVTLKLGEDYLSSLKGDYLFKTPGMRFDAPELLLFEEAGGIVTSEMEVFFDICPARIFSVTGSDGKTTTTTLIYEILKKEGYNVHLGGNIGKPLLPEINNIKSDDMVVVELSSFQLQTMKKSPEIAIITNLAPNHLDMHKSMEEYVSAKENIFKYQDSYGKVILNYDNDITKNIGKKAKSNVVYFSRIDNSGKGGYIKNNSIFYDNDYVMDISDIRLPGVHNVENYLAAICAVYEFVSKESIKYVANNFYGVKHRIQFVREINGVTYYNDSIASSPSRTLACLNAFDKKIIMIAGGKDKGVPFDVLGEPIVNNVKSLILIGQTANAIANAVKAVQPDFPIYFEGSLENAVKKSYEISEINDVVVLSPASTSFDMFKNFEERGDKFIEYVNTL